MFNSLVKQFDYNCLTSFSSLGVFFHFKNTHKERVIRDNELNKFNLPTERERAEE